jgi:hypothetical protein
MCCTAIFCFPDSTDASYLNVEAHTDASSGMSSRVVGFYQQQTCFLVSASFAIMHIVLK